MVKEIKMYQTENGKIFNTKETAELYENRYKKSMEGYELLGGTVLSDGFSNGEGVVLISKENYEKSKKILEELLEEIFGEKEPHPRYIDDSLEAQVCRNLFVTLNMCTLKTSEGNYIRVGQPYFKNNLESLENDEVIKRVGL